MDTAAVLLILLVALAAAGAGVAFGRAGSRRRGPGVEAAVAEGVAQALAAQRAQAGAERDAAVRAALEQAAVLQREQLAAHLAAGQHDLAAKKDGIEAGLQRVQAEMKGELARIGELLGDLGRRSAEQFGRVDQSLQAHAEITQSLSTSAQSLREALASPKARGQWGERMADDVLRLAGFVERVNYVKQTAVEGGRAMPDFTFFMPRDHVLYMDVKFPLANYLRYLEAGTDAERQAYREAFVRDVRLRVKELAQREYARAGDRPAVDYVLLFLPNESIAGFIHEQDPGLVEQALTQKILLCSPLTLFAFLGVIRQAFDQFMLEQTSNEMLQLLGRFSQQWGKFTESMDRVRTRFESVQREFEALATTRRRQLERPLQALDELRLQRGVPVDGELFGADVLELDGYRGAGA